MPGVVDAALAEIGRKREVGLIVPNFLLAPHAVAGTDMILTVGRRIAIAFAGSLELRAFTTPLALQSYQVAMGWHVRTEGDAAVEWLKHEIRGHACSLAALDPLQTAQYSSYGRPMPR